MKVDDFMKQMNFKGVVVNYIEVEANPELGFYFPFIIIIPQTIVENPELIYACNLTANNSENCSTMEELIYCAKEENVEERRKFRSIDPIHYHLCVDDGNPMVIPYIPRLKDFRPNFLGKDCLLNDFKLKGTDKRFEKYMYMYKNLADQHKAIIETAVNVLKAEKIDVSEKATLCGYSEGAKFVSHLSLLHPEIIKGVIAGGTGGAISMPVSKIDGYEFKYPTGISGLPNFDFESFKKIFFFFYVGDADKSDSAIPYFENYTFINDKGEEELYRDECGNLTPRIDENGNQVFVLDENGNYTAKYGLFSDEDVNCINKVLGTRVQERFIKQQRIYESLGLNSTSIMYAGNHRSVFKQKELIFKDLDVFIQENLKKDNLKK